MLGSYESDAATLSFRPAFPLRPGLSYRAIFRPTVLATILNLGALEELEALSEDFQVRQAPIDRPPAQVSAVYPSGSELPENLLKFYLHFSEPMRQGGVYSHVSIVDASGRKVEAVILELENELWDREGRRLTLLFDPGRIKSGLRPNREIGPALESDVDFELVVADSWLDAEGRPLKQAFRKPFRVSAPDHASPDPGLWTIGPPSGGTREPLTVELGESLDQALLQHMLWVTDSLARPVAGSVVVGFEERSWSLLPEQPWQPGRYELNVNPRLEDVAGNSIAKPFEVDLLRAESQSTPSETQVRLPFEIH